MSAQTKTLRSNNSFRWMSADPAAKLGEHIATFYWSGVLTSDNELFISYWRNAPTAARAHTVEFLGRSAHEATALTADVASSAGIGTRSAEVARSERIRMLCPASTARVAS